VASNALPLAAFCLGCGAHIRTAASDWERGADLGPSKTFSIVRSPRMSNLKPEQEALLALVEKTAKQELIQKGYKEAPVDTAQLVATPYVLSRERAEVTVLSYTCNQHVYAQAGNVLPSYALPPCEESTISEIQEGILVIDVYDSARKELVWHGWASAERPKPGSSGTPALIEQATRNVLAIFPP
jgi:hypothetical protein